jgi:mRNA-degrading endonuclease RelE of RelBE toxin-antitoxin system
MKIAFSDRAVESLNDAPPAVRTAFSKQIRFLVGNLHHPSLRAKKYDEGRNLWQARVNRSWRFYFTIVEDVYQIEDVIPHPK